MASGADALRKLADTRPDVIFMDYMMPEMDGLEACRAIVGNPATAAIPVIMTTSNDTPEFRKRGVASGARGFLSKGLEDRELDNVLDAVVDVPEPAPAREAPAAVESARVQLDEATLAMIRDQAINAARRASEEYFTGQLPGLEEQVVQVAENTARRAAGGGHAPAADGDELHALRSRLDNLGNDRALRSAVIKIMREESGGSRRPRPDAVASSQREAHRRGSSSGFGRLLRNLLLLAILAVIAYFVIVMFFPDSSLALRLSDLVAALLARAGAG